MRLNQLIDDFSKLGIENLDIKTLDIILMM